MRRRLAYLLSAALVMTSAAVFTSAQPAAATDVCAGVGSATTGQGLYYPPGITATVDANNVWIHATIGKAAQTTFGFNLTTPATCLLGKDLGTVSGLVLGWCGLSTGGGTTGNGGTFGWVGVGSFLILTGHVTGVVVAIPNVPAGESCAPNGAGADNFIVAGGVVLVHCAVLTSTKSLPLDILIPIITTHTQVLSVLIGFELSVHAQVHTWTNACVPGPL